MAGPKKGTKKRNKFLKLVFQHQKTLLEKNLDSDPLGYSHLFRKNAKEKVDLEADAVKKALISSLVTKCQLEEKEVCKSDLVFVFGFALVSVYVLLDVRLSAKCFDKQQTLLLFWLHC